MKILVNAIHSKAGGGVTYVNGLLPHLLEQGGDGLEIEVVCHKKYRSVLQVPEGVTVREMTFRDGFVFTLLWEQFVLPFLARKWKANVTLNIANFAPLLAPKPVILLTNNPEVRHHVPFKEKFYWWVLLGMTWLSMIRCPVVLTNGMELGMSLADGWKFLEKKLVNAPMGVDVPKGGSLVKDDNLIVAVGNIYKHKDYPTLVQAFARVRKKHPNVRLMIFGKPVDTEATQDTLSVINSLSLKEAILVTPAPHDTVLKTLKKAKLYVSSSRAETFSATLVEAMACGAPSVVADYGFNREVGGEDGAVYATFENRANPSHELATAMLTVLENGGLQEQLRTAGKEAAKKFSWAATATNVLRSLQ